MKIMLSLLHNSEVKLAIRHCTSHFLISPLHVNAHNKFNYSDPTILSKSPQNYSIIYKNGMKSLFKYTF